MSGPAQRQNRLRVLGTVAGVLAGVLVFAALRGRAHSGAVSPPSSTSLVVGALLVFSGTKNLFMRAAFPERSSEPARQRLRYAVVNAGVVLGGVGQLLHELGGIWLSCLSLAMILLAALGVPKRIFGSRA